MKALQKTNFKLQPGKNSPTKPTISNSVQRKQQNRTFPDAIRNPKLAICAFSRHMFLKKCQRNRETILRNQLQTSVYKQKK